MRGMDQLQANPRACGLAQSAGMLQQMHPQEAGGQSPPTPSIPRNSHFCGTLEGDDGPLRVIDLSITARGLRFFLSRPSTHGNWVTASHLAELQHADGSWKAEGVIARRNGFEMASWAVCLLLEEDSDAGSLVRANIRVKSDGRECRFSGPLTPARPSAYVADPDRPRSNIDQEQEQEQP